MSATPHAEVGRPLSLTADESALLLECLGRMADEAPCPPRIHAVMASVGSSAAEEANGLSPVFARALSMAAVIWAIDTGRIDEQRGELAQHVMDALWRLGPVRPDLVATQLACLVGQGDEELRCFWTCSTLTRDNAGYATGAGPIRVSQVGLAGSMLLGEGQPTLPGIDDRHRSGAQGGGHRHGEPVPCLSCGRDGTILGVDPKDGWTVVDHYPKVEQRPDGMWAVDRASVAGPRQCRYLETAGELRGS